MELPYNVSMRLSCINGAVGLHVSGAMHRIEQVEAMKVAPAETRSHSGVGVEG